MSCSRARRVLVVLAAAVLAACSANDGTPRVQDTLPPGSDDVPGTLLVADPLPGEFGDASWRVQYRSVDVDGAPTTVTGVVARPDGPAPEGGYPVLAFGHGTTGIADACAPSATASGLDPIVGRFVDAGWVVVATDYEGLGGPGVHPYLVADSAARSMLDAARAAIALVPDTSSRVVLHGVSQGGHASLAAAERSAELAPDLEILGTVAVAPAADAGVVLHAGVEDPAFVGFAVIIAAAWSAAYDELFPEDLLTPSGLDLATAATEDVCFGELYGELGTATSAVVRSAEDVPARWWEVARRNSIDGTRVAGPVLVTHGRSDEVVPLSVSDDLAEVMCAAGGVVELRRYDADHGEIVDVALEDTVAWADDRLAGVAPPTSC